MDAMIKDQTARVVQRFTKSHKTDQVHNVFPSFLVAPCPGFLHEQGARGWFFSTFTPDTRDWQTSHGHFDCVLPLFKADKLQPLLSLTITWLSILLLGTTVRGRSCAREYELLAKIIRLLQQDIVHDAVAGDATILLVIIMLQFGQDVRTQRYTDTKLHLYVHQRAAESIVRSGTCDTSDPALNTLRAAARQNALLYSLLDHSVGFDTGLWNSCSFLAGIEDQNLAVQLDSYGVALLTASQRKAQPLRSQDLSGLPTIEVEIARVIHELHLWTLNVPRHWKPIIISRFHHVYPRADICYLFSQCYLLQIKAFVISLQDSPSNTPVEPELNALIDNIMALENSYLQQPDSTAVVSNELVEITALPRATVTQCRQSPVGSRFLNITLRIFVNIVQEVMICPHIQNRLRIRCRRSIDWAERELSTVRRAYPTVQQSP